LVHPNFTFEDEGHPPVAIINHAMARRYFGDANPVGRHFTAEGQGGPYEIVGVVAGAKYNDLHEAAPETIYLNAFRQGADRFAQFSVRTNVAPAALAGAVRSAVRDVLKTVLVARMATLTDQVDATLTPERFIATLSGLFGTLGAALAAIGLYGLLAYTVTRRITEIGIRMAIGATRGNVMRMVLTSALGLVCAGLAIGIPISAWGRHTAASVLHSPPAEAVVIPIVIGAAAMMALALASAYVPARRASRIHPMDALRHIPR
jgi:ABC-type antimicrobial peptide transport system permease subunit